MLLEILILLSKIYDFGVRGEGNNNNDDDNNNGPVDRGGGKSVVPPLQSCSLRARS